MYQNVHQWTQIFKCWRFYSDSAYWIVNSHLAETRLHWVHSIHSLCNDLEYFSSSTLPLSSLCCLHRTVSAFLTFLSSILEQPIPTIITSTIPTLLLGCREGWNTRHITANDVQLMYLGCNKLSTNSQQSSMWGEGRLTVAFRYHIKIAG